MNAKKCDRCGTLYNIKKDIPKPKYRLSVHHPYKDRFYKPIDLCEKCNAELDKWFDKKSKPK